MFSTYITKDIPGRLYILEGKSCEWSQLMEKRKKNRRPRKTDNQRTRILYHAASEINSDEISAHIQQPSFHFEVGDVTGRTYS